jgi:hypothetical protein
MTDPEPPSPDARRQLDDVRQLLAREEMWLAPPPELLRLILDCIAAEPTEPL